MSLMVGPIRSDLDISDTQLSLLHGFAFALLYAIFGLPIGAIVDRCDRRKVLMLGTAAWSAFTALCGTADDFAELFLYRVGVGIGEATVVPVTYSLLADYFEREWRGLAMGIFGTSVYLGMGAALVAGGAIIQSLGTAGNISIPLLGALRPWEAVFILVGAPGLALALLALRVLEPRNRSDGRASNMERVDLRAVLRQLRGRGAALTCHHGSTAFLAMALYALVSWAPESFHRSHGVATGSIGIRIGLAIAAAGTLGVLAGGAFSDMLLRRGHDSARMLTLLCASVGAIPFAASFPLAASAGHSLLLMAAATFFLSMLTTAGPSGVQELHPASMRGVGSAIFQLIVTLIGLGLGPTLIALFGDYVLRDDARLNYALACCLPAMLVSAAVLAAMGLRPYRRAVARLRSSRED